MRPRLAPWQAAFIHAANPHPYRRHHRQSTSPPPPSRAGPRAGGRGHWRSPLDRKAGDEGAVLPIADAAVMLQL